MRPNSILLTFIRLGRCITLSRTLVGNSEFWNCITGSSLVSQYPITLVHIVGFKIIKNQTNILQVLGDERFKVGVGRVVYKY